MYGYVTDYTDGRQGFTPPTILRAITPPPSAGYQSSQLLAGTPDGLAAQPGTLRLAGPERRWRIINDQDQEISATLTPKRWRREPAVYRQYFDASVFKLCSATRTTPTNRIH
jgi:hypothetical protein